VHCVARETASVSRACMRKGKESRVVCLYSKNKVPSASAGEGLCRWEREKSVCVSIDGGRELL
jgi:hypothetical protein